MEPFRILITTTSGNWRLDVERKYVMSEIERYEVRAKNHIFQLDVNRSVLLKKNLIHLPWDWTLVAGKCPGWFQVEMQREIEKVLRRL